MMDNSLSGGPGSTNLQTLAQQMRQYIITMNCHAGSGHPGGALSCVELLTWLFHRQLNFSADRLDDPDRDRFVLSKGHACMALYAALAQKGIISTSEFKGLRQVDGMLQGHPDRLKTPGVEFNSGSLGQGFSFAIGCALGNQRRGSSARTYALLGDGELNEGQVWEGLMFAAHHRLERLTAIVDYNKLQSDARNEKITALEPLLDKFRAFGWHAVEIDGHDFGQIEQAFAEAGRQSELPSLILAHTVKGKGISFMEDVPKWHGSLAPQREERRRALQEVGLEELPR